MSIIIFSIGVGLMVASALMRRETKKVTNDMMMRHYVAYKNSVK